MPHQPQHPEATPGEQRWASLAACCAALFEETGPEWSPEVWSGLLGLSGRFVAAKDHLPGRWPLLAQDAMLEPTAAAVGLGLRDLHPPQATAGLRDSPEFRLHFHDSYVPLIRRALRAGQVCLAWRGWKTAPWAWGIITAERGGELVGRPGGAWDDVPLSDPAWQVYVVEKVEPAIARGLSRDALFDLAWRNAVALWQNRVQATHGQLSGAEAWLAWREAADQDPPAWDHGLVGRLREARSELATWLVGFAAELSADRRSLAEDWAGAATRQVELAGTPPFEVAQTIEALYKIEHGLFDRHGGG
jgi:hypothetical protein